MVIILTGVALVRQAGTPKISASTRSIYDLSRNGTWQNDFESAEDLTHP
jgi:hypothetical protein